MNPHRLTWGLAYDFPFVQLIALCTLVGIAAAALKERGFLRIPWQRETFLLIALWVMFTLTTLVAQRPDLAWPEWQDTSKIYLMVATTLLLVKDERTFRYVLLVIALSLGFYGAKGGLFVLATGGQYRVWGPARSFIEDNNAVGLALNMILPFLFYLAKGEPISWLRRLLQLVFFLTILAVLFTYSRGAFLGLAVVLGVIFLGLKLKAKIAIGVLMLLLIPAGLSTIPGKWFDRMYSIQNYLEDQSAVSRLEAWEVAWKVARDRPLTGGGFQIINDVATYHRYKPDAVLMTGVHSVYFELLAENGFITCGIFTFLLISALTSTMKVRRLAWKHDLQNYYYYACMLQISLLAYAVSGMFLEFGSFELYYQIIALVVLLKALFAKELERVSRQATATQKPEPASAIQSPDST
jgi:probable O-glycosylation ligase (exosortase A-associated)